MTKPTKEDIGRRALLDVLTPSAQTQLSPTGIGRRKMKRFRSNKRLHDEAVSSAEAVSRPTCIAIVERPSSETVSVCWSDATMGRYSEQIWRLGRARTSSLCLLSGRVIRYGDEVYRSPAQQGCLSVDQDRMILACAVDEATSSTGVAEHAQRA